MFKLPIERLRSLAKTVAGPVRGKSATRPPIERIAWAISAAGSRIPGGRNCLAQAISAEALLARFGHSSDLKIGARRTDAGNLEAHAWIESGGQVIVGAFELETYAVMSRMGRRL